MNPTWSYSALNHFETCPAQYAAERVYKTIERRDNEASIWGIEVHNAIEHRLRNGGTLPERFKSYESVSALVEGITGDHFYEEQMALNRLYRPVDWTAKDVWVRGILDVLVVNKDKAIALDWKTGKRKLDAMQLHLFALMVFAHFPEVLHITTVFQWLKFGKSDRAIYHREDIDELWKPLLDRYHKLEEAFQLDIWTPKPSGLCKNYCAHTECEYHGVGNRRY